MQPHRFNPKPICPGIKVEVNGGNVERAIRTFSKKVQDNKILLEIYDREHYSKPSEIKKRKKAAAKKRWLKKVAKNQRPAKNY